MIANLLSDAPTVVVLGDVMLDHYISGRVSRISPEAPVPVLQNISDRAVAGGAANVALNLVSVGASARLIGLVGADESGAQLTQILGDAGLVTDFVTSAAVSTITKTRVLAGGAHQFIRIDRETIAPPAPEVVAAILARLDETLPDAGALVISDYGKGLLSDAVLTGAIERARALGVQVLIDPKRADFAGYAGATVIKPNLAELTAATGLDCSTTEGRIAATRRIAQATGADVLLTMSEKGMAYYRADGGAPVEMPSRVREVYDVSGAGDTVMALFAAFRAAGASVERSMQAANAAAGVVVTKAGTATLTVDELEQALSDAPRPFDGGGQVVDRDAARALAEGWRAAGLRVGFTNGCFDLIHPGHVRILHGARGACDRLVVGLNTDASVKRLKGPSRPVQTEAARAQVVAALTGVDAVVLFDEETPLELIRALEPDVLVKGADYTVESIVGADLVLARGGRVERVPLVEGQSTSALIRRSTGEEARATRSETA